MGIVERSSFVLGCGLWEENFESLLNCNGGTHVLGRLNCMESQALHSSFSSSLSIIITRVHKTIYCLPH